MALTSIVIAFDGGQMSVIAIHFMDIKSTTS